MIRRGKDTNPSHFRFSVRDRKSLPLILLNCNTLQIINTQTQTHTHIYTLIHGTLNPLQCDDSKAKTTKQTMQQYEKILTTQQNVQEVCAVVHVCSRTCHICVSLRLVNLRLKLPECVCLCVGSPTITKQPRMNEKKRITKQS